MGSFSRFPHSSDVLVRKKRRSPVLFLLLIPVCVFGYTYYHLHEAWSGTGSAHNAGEHIYNELKAIEPDVFSGKIKDSHAPALEQTAKEISNYSAAHKNESFDDTMLFGSLANYRTELSMMAAANASPGPNGSAERGRDLTSLSEAKADIEKYLK